MRRVLGWMVMTVLCCGAGGVDPARLMEAQEDFDASKTLRSTGQYVEALIRAEHALALREDVLGATHLEVASCLTQVGSLYRLQGQLAQAEPLLRRALAIREAALGESHLDVADALGNLASLYANQGSYERAEPLFRRALTIGEQRLGATHPQLAISLNNLAILHFQQGLYERAEPLYRRALAIREAALAPDHPDIAYSLNNLAVLACAQGRYRQAEPLYRRALAIREATLGDKHPLTATSIHNLAVLASAQGAYGQAELLYRRALAIHEAVHGKHHPAVALSLNNLANLYREQGMTARAEPLYQRALELREAALGPDHPDVADSLNNLAAFYHDQELYARALALFQRALEVREAALGPNHLDVAHTLINLAATHHAQGQYGRAEPLLQRAFALFRAAHGENHPDYAIALNDLGNLYRAQGQYERAEPLYQRALDIWEAALGPDHPDVALALTNLARLHLARHRLDEALPLLTRAFAISEQRLRREALDFSETRLASFLRHLDGYEELIHALLRTYPNDARVQRLALSKVLLRKGRSVEEMASVSRTIHHNLGEADRGILERLRGLRTQLAALSLEGPGVHTGSDHGRRLQQLASEGDALEADLAQRSAPLRALTGLPPPEAIVDRVAASLPPDTALVEFVASSDRPLVPKPGVPPARTPSPLRYLALVLFPDASIRTVELGPAESIDRAAANLREALAHRSPTFQAIAQELHRLVFQPVRPLLGTTRRLLLSPEGQLNLIPFSSLHDGQGYLLDTFDFTYLTSGRELLPRPQGIAPSTSVVVLADPDFSRPAASSASAEVPMAPDALERFFAAPPPELSRAAWASLPGTRLEAEDIQRLLPQARLFLGAEASKERLMHLPLPGILHVATHGFFLGDARPAPDSREAVALNASSTLPPPQQEPLLNSGLVLAGSNLLSGSGLTHSDASLVTALELAGLNLWGTQLVVLSACDTGRGEVQPSQGLYGLRRALVVAGAETVVSSLWKVNDDSTRLLMGAYYRNLLAGQGRSSALREAMRSLRETHDHPYYWAPFIALGSDAPLSAMNAAAP